MSFVDGILYMSSRFFKNEPNQKKFEAIWEKKGQKAGFFGPDKLENHTSEGKGRRESQERRLEKKPAKENKAMCCTLSSFQFYFGLLDGFELHSRWVPPNVFKNLNRCIRQQINKRNKSNMSSYCKKCQFLGFAHSLQRDVLKTSREKVSPCSCINLYL